MERASKAPGTSNTQNHGKLENHMVESVSSLRTKNVNHEKCVVVVTSQEKELQNFSISAPQDPPIETQNIFRNLTQEQDEHIEKEHLQVTQNDHNVNSTGQVPLQQGTLTIEATYNTLVQTESRERFGTNQRQLLKRNSQHLQSDDDEEVLESLAEDFAPGEENHMEEVVEQMKETIDKCCLSPRGTPTIKKKSFKTYPPSTPITRGRGKSNKQNQS